MSLTIQQIEERRAKSDAISQKHFHICAAGMMNDALSGMLKKVTQRCGVTACTSYESGANCMKCHNGRRQLGKGL